MKHFLTVLLAVLLLAGCSKETPTPPAESSERVVLAYLISNNYSGTNLDDYLKNNVRWMYQSLASSTKAVSLLVFYRPYASDRILNYPCVLRFDADGKGHINDEDALSGTNLTNDNVLRQAKIVKEYTETKFIATDPTTMRTVLSDMKTIAPSTKYGLIFASHGTGWMKGKKTTSRSFGEDNTYSINIPEMANAIQTAFSGKKVDFIIFDACMMGTAEVYYELRNATNYCIASVLESPIDGMPYNKFFTTLYDDSPNYEKVMDYTIEYNKQTGSWGTYALVDCSKMDQLAQAFKEQINANATLAKSVDYTKSSKLLQYGLAANGYEYFSFDMLEYIKLLNDGTVPESFQKVFDNVVLYKTSMSDRVYLQENERFGGMGVYLPGRNIKSEWDSYYPNLAWYSAAGWSELN